MQNVIRFLRIGIYFFMIIKKKCNQFAVVYYAFISKKFSRSLINFMIQLMFFLPNQLFKYYIHIYILFSTTIILSILLAVLRLHYILIDGQKDKRNDRQIDDRQF